MKNPAAGVVSILAICASVGAFAQNVVNTPDFNNATVTPPWMPSNATIAFDAGQDVVGTPGSGSLSVTNPVANGATVSAHECIDQPFPSGQYDFGGWILFPSGQGGQGSASAGIAVSFYSGAACGGNSLGFANVPVSSLDVWGLQSGMISAPSNVLSAAIDLRIDTSVGASPPIQAWFDGIRLGPTPTTPVELQNFDVE